VQNVRVNPKISLQIANERFTGEVAEITDANEFKHAVSVMPRKYPLSVPYLWFKKLDGAFRVRLDPA
jgi:hypothetical protein